MYVNISRSKQLFNNRRIKRKVSKPSEPENRCYHCGGAIRMNGELTTCLMCSREVGHMCDRCTHIPAQEESKKKSA